MKRIKQILPLLLVALLLVACVKEDLGNTLPQYNGSTVNMHLTLTNGARGMDTELDAVRILVFSGGTQVLNELFTTPPDDNPTYELDVADGINNFYIFCNPTIEVENKIAAITAESNLSQITFEAKAFASKEMPKLPMYGQVSGVSVDKKSNGSITVTVGTTTSSKLTVPVDRLMARLSMTVIKSTPEFTVKSMSYQIHRIPKYMYIGKDTPYTESIYQSNIFNTGNGELLTDGEYDKTQKPYLVTSGDYITFPDMYLPEHLLTDKTDQTQCTYMVITANCVLTGSNVEVSSVYTIDLGTLPPANLNLIRNNHYHLFATLKNLGLMGFYAEIIPLTEYNTPITWKPFEGYTIVSEKADSYGLDEKIWNDYFQYYGILKVTRKNSSTNKSLIYPALFRYGSVVALTERSGTFNASLFDPVNNKNGDLLYYPNLTTKPTSWSSVGYLASGDVVDANHTSDNIKQGKGDPCRLAGLSNADIDGNEIDNKLWRTASDEQMRWLIEARNPEVVSSTQGFHTFGLAVLTPKTSGKRAAADGSMVPVANAGSYWSSIATNLFSFSTTDNTAALATGVPEEAHAIRCIRTDIPSSRFGVTNIQVPYTGGTIRWDHIFYFADNIYNTPFWKITGWDSSNGLDFTKKSGYYHNSKDYEVPEFIIPQSKDAYELSLYKVDIEGYGLDGKIHKVTSQIRQEIKVHNLTLNKNIFGKIPAAGATYTFSISIDPAPIEKHAPGGAKPYEEMQWYVRARWVAPSGTQIIVSNTVTAVETTTITIPENTSSEEIGVIFEFQKLEGFIPSDLVDSPNGNGTYYYVQNKGK